MVRDGSRLSRELRELSELWDLRELWGVWELRELSSHLMLSLNNY